MMKKNWKETAHKPWRVPKSREVSSRFLSSPGSTPQHDSGIPLPNQASSPIRKTLVAHSLDSKWALHGCKNPGPQQGLLWPSATTTSAPSNTNNERLDTLADHLGNDRLKDLLERKISNENVSSHSALFLRRQLSCSEISRFEGDCQKGSSNSSSCLKETQRPILGGSMRYAGKLVFPGRKSSFSAASKYSSSFESPKVLLQGRLSIDENTLYKHSSCRISESDPFLDVFNSESESSEVSSSCTSNLSSASKKSGREVSSRYMSNLTTRTKRDNLDLGLPNSMLLDHDTEKSKKFTIKGAIKRAGSLTGYGSSRSQWALSPGRTGSPPMSVENKSRPPSFFSMKPPSSPSRPKGMEKFLNMGLDLFKSKKSSPSNMSPACFSSGGEIFHQFWLLHNRLIQWMFANAKAHVASQKITDRAETSLLSSWESLRKLRYRVVQRKLQLEKERLEMKLNCILHSQMKPLEDWEDMERQQSSAISDTTESLLSIICRIPLKDSAKANPTSTSHAILNASDLTSSIKSLLNGLTHSVESIAPLLSKLAEVVAQENLLLQECLEHLKIISLLEIEEWNLACTMLQVCSCPQQQ